MRKNFITLVTLVLLIASPSMAQLRMRSMMQSGSPSKFMKAHPEYIYLNKPERDNVTGFSYYISETLNPRGAGLNGSNYYIIIESFDHNEKPKALIWDGVLKQKLVKRMSTSAKRVVYFNNTFILDEKNLLTFLGYDEKYKIILKCGLSSNGTSYAKNWWQKHTISGNFTTFANLEVKTEWAENPAQWLKEKLTADKTHRNVSIQDPSTLTGTYGWFFDIKNCVSKADDDKYNYYYEPKLYLWKDKDHSIPLNICKMAGTEFSYHPDMNRDEATYENVVKLSKAFNPDAHQYYFLDWSAFADVEDVEMLPNGQARLKLYYTVDLNAKMANRRKGHVLISMAKDGVITLDADIVSESPFRKVEKGTDPRWLCPPHKYEYVGSADNYTLNKSSYKSKPKSALPSRVSINMGEKQLELLRQEASDGSVYYISKKPVNSDLWKFAMKSNNRYELTSEFYNEDKSYNRVLEFLAKLNEKTRNLNIPYTFILPTFEELKKYASNNDNFNSYYPSFVDSIQLRSSLGDLLTLERYLAYKDKARTSIMGGILKDTDQFECVLVNDSTRRIQFYIKAIPDSQQKEVKKTSVTRLGLLKKIVMRCSKCGKEIYTYRRANNKTIHQMIESVDDEDEDLNVYGFCEGLYKMKDETLIDNALLKKKWKYCYGSSNKKTYETANGLYRIETKKKKKKDSFIESLELKFDSPETNEVFKAIEDLGYKCVKKDLNVPSTYGEPRDYRYDCYFYSNDEGYNIMLSVFTYNKAKVSYYVTFKKY